jgi:DNA ligase (NAD+)
MTWVKKRNILNLGISVIEAAELKSISHLYKMETKDWADIQVLNGRYGLKRAIKVTEALNKSRLVTLPDFLGSIGIKGIGRTLSRVLCDSLELKTIYDAFSVLPDQIEGLDGFGPTRAYDFCDWISDNSNEIQELSSIMNFENVSGDNIGAFYGEIICFTGKSPKPRSEMSRLAEEAGASVSSSVKSDTTILVIADTNSTSSKAIKARKLGVKLISPEDFLGKVVH